MSVSPAKRKAVTERARFLCEYCVSPKGFSPASFSIEHIHPKSKKGTDEPENLTLACQGCNSYKSDKISAIDPINGRIAPLYNPRKDVWEEHFLWNEDFTAKGRATINLLKLNREEVVNLRRVLHLFSEHPPK